MEWKIYVLPREVLTRRNTCDIKQIVRKSAEVIVDRNIEGPNVYIVQITISNVQVEVGQIAENDEKVIVKIFKNPRKVD